jgi:hypothetical protein
MALSGQDPPEPIPTRQRLRQTGYKPASLKVTDADWPMFGGNSARDHSSAAEVPDELELKWSADLDRPLTDSVISSPLLHDWSFTNKYRNSPITTPVAAGGVAVVAQPQRQAVVAVGVKDGSELWRYLAGGRIDSPPTLVDGGLCVFGSRDGYVHALDAHTGKLVWRFLAAPSEQYVVDNSQPESQWPVSGSVLSVHGSIWTAAGRHPELGGGITIYRLDPLTGKVQWEHTEGRQFWHDERQPEEEWPDPVRGNANMRQLNSVVNGMMFTADNLVFLAGLAIDPATGSVARLRQQLPYGPHHEQYGDSSKVQVLFATFDGGERRVFPFLTKYHNAAPESYLHLEPTFDVKSEWKHL